MAQNEAKTKDIDGVKYSVRMLPPKVARRMLVEMAKVAGPVLGALTKKGLETEVNFQEVFEGVSENLTPELLDVHMSLLTDVSEADGVPLKTIFDVHFMGKVGLMFKWYLFALQVNFEDFISAFRSVTSVRVEKAKVA